MIKIIMLTVLVLSGVSKSYADSEEQSDTSASEYKKPYDCFIQNETSNNIFTNMILLSTYEVRVLEGNGKYYYQNSSLNKDEAVDLLKRFQSLGVCK